MSYYLYLRKNISLNTFRTIKQENKILINILLNKNFKKNKSFVTKS